MKRLTISILILASLATLGFARAAGPRVPSRTPARKLIQLTPPKLKGSISFEEALAKRRSVRQYANRLVEFPLIGQLAWAGQGITELQKGLRTAPSAGATYPIDLYFATPEGLFVYRPQQHSLEQTLTDDVRAVLGVPPAPCDIIIGGSARKLTDQFRDKAKTYMLLEAGHIAQNIQLQAVCLGLGSVTIGGIDTRQVARVCRLPRNYEAIYVISVGYAATETATGNEPNVPTQTPLTLGKKAALIIPSRDFRDDELVETKRALDMAGIETVIASTRRGIVRGMLGNMVEAKVMLSGLRVDDYDAIVFIGGPGVEEYFDNALAKSIARDAAAKRKIVAAISAAPTILANAGALTGIRATAFLSEQEKLQQGGAIFTGAPLERDAYIITCSGPAMAVQFGRAIAEALTGR